MNASCSASIMELPRPQDVLTTESGLTSYYSFCSQYHLTTIPASSLTLQYFYTQQSQQISYRTIKVYLAGIRLAHIEAGMPDPTTDSLLQLVCRGIRCLQGDSHRTRLPITINLLRSYFEEPIRPISL